MSRYIDAEKCLKEHSMIAIDWQDLLEDETLTPTADVVDRAKFKRLLENSTIMADALKEYENEDVVKVVRCKDCKWKQGFECVRFADVRLFVDDYCSRAERREDDER